MYILQSTTGHKRFHIFFVYGQGFIIAQNGILRFVFFGQKYSLLYT